MATRCKRHWYFITIEECPVCGGGHTYRERRYGRKPKSPARRYEWIQAYDWCIEYGRT